MNQQGSTQASAQSEISQGDRFAFGQNWARFQQVLDDERIEDAVRSLREMLEVDTLAGRSFLDIGSGSGLFSLAARRLGATVHSFDFDQDSVACTQRLKQLYCPSDPNWVIEQGSVLDEAFMATLGTYDIVYSWGVLHHTGRMWPACAAAVERVAPGGLLFIALYNDQGLASRYWTVVKRLYCSSRIMRPVVLGAHLFYPLLPTYISRKIKSAKEPRGMSIMHDFVDWMGGYPFEVSTPAQVFEFHRERGFALRKIRTVGGKMGCNEFVFRRQAEGAGEMSQHP
jgi:2-polyprenyl-3-methyl-5-hydroxy-6-metoxy-1,4-benzoquinol methylase